MAASQNREVATAAKPVVWVWDHDRRRIVWADDGALRFWGERTVLDLLDRDFPPSDPATEQFARLLHAASADETGRARGRLTLTPATGPRRVDAVAVRFALADGRIGLRVHAMPLPVGMESEPERMRDIFATAPQAMTLFGEDGRMLVQNDAATLTFGEGRLASLAARYGARQPARDALRALLVSGSFSEAVTLDTRAGPRRHRITMRRMLDPVTGAFAALASFSDAVERDAVPALPAMGQAPGMSDDRAILDAVDAPVAVYDDALKPLYLNAPARDVLGAKASAKTLADLSADGRERLAAALVDMRDARRDTATLDLVVAERAFEARIRRGEWQGAGAWLVTFAERSLAERAAIALQRAADDRDSALGAIGIGTVSLRADATVVEMNAMAADLLEWSPAPDRPVMEAFDKAGAVALAEALERANAVAALDLTLRDGTQTLRVGLGPATQHNRAYRILTLRSSDTRSGDSPGIFERREAVSRASHELRTPLNAILGFTQLMLHDPDPIQSAAYRGYLEDINESGAYMLRLLQDMLDMRRVEADTLTLDTAPIDIGNLLRLIARDVEFAARKRDVDIVLSIEPDLSPVLADRHTMRQALTNLIGNAVKFTAASGWVRVSALRRASGAVQVEVIDNGRGMTADELALALEPFGQMPGSSQSFGGAGMGVPLAKGFIEANRARFELTSEKEVGTIARVVFPPGRVAKKDG